MHIRVCQATAMLFAVCLLLGVPFDSSYRTTHGQQRERRANAIVRERGVIESAQVEVRNRLPGQTKIVFMVAEGTHVKEGDVIVRLDSTEVEESIARQQLEATQARAKLQHAESELESIKRDGALQVKIIERMLELARSEKERVLGEDGELAVEQTVVESEIAIAKARLDTARLLLQHVDTDPLRREEMGLRFTEARESLKVAEARKRFLDGPRRKHETIVRDLAIAERVAELERHKLHQTRSIDGATTEVAAQQAAFGHFSQRLDRAKELLRHCQIVAPQDGMVVYPITRGSRASGFDFEADATAREREVLVRLADLSQLQVMLYVSESDLERLRVGQPASIEIDAFPDKTNTGKVTAVISVGAEPPTQADSDVRRYAVIVSLDDPPAQAKLGLTATVAIKVGAEETE